MARWTAFPYDAADYRYDDDALRAHWARLHQGDAEPLPDDPAVRAAWALFHAGRFEQARDAGLPLGDAGLAVANKAQFIHADYLETSEGARRALWGELIVRAEAQVQAAPGRADAHYWLARALGRYSQGVNVAKAQAQGLDARVRVALEATIALSPRHADAHAALGSFHAEVIDTVGRQLGKARGADAATGLKLFKEALALNPHSAMTRIAYADGLVMLEGERRMKEAEGLYAEAARCVPLDATERLEAEIARARLADD